MKVQRGYLYRSSFSLWRIRQIAVTLPVRATKVKKITGNTRTLYVRSGCAEVQSVNPNAIVGIIGTRANAVMKNFASELRTIRFMFGIGAPSNTAFPC